LTTYQADRKVAKLLETALESGGYAKRCGAIYADTASAAFIGDTILPSLLKQDSPLFLQGNRQQASRILYALANSVICKKNNGHWQPNYS